MNKVNDWSKTSRRLRHLVSVILVFCLVLLIASVDWQAGAQIPKNAKSEDPAAPQESELPKVRVETVETVTASQPESILAVVDAKETVTLVPRVSGYLMNVAFQEGSMVQKGDLLFEIEDTVYNMNVKVAESVVRQIEAEIELAKRDLERIQTLHRSSVATDQEMDQARRTINLHEARVDEAKATLGLAENDLSYTKIHAPLTGRIGAKQFSEGNYLTPTSGTLATIVQYDPITVLFTLSEAKFIRYFLEAESGAKQAYIEIFRTDGKPYTGEFRIDFTDNLVDRDTGTMAIHLICPNAGDQLLPGGWCRVQISEHFKQPVPAVAAAAVMTDGDRHYVYVLITDDKLERRDIVLGEQVYNRYMVTEGLQEGERVVVGGLNKVVSGDRVHAIMVEPEAPEGELEPTPETE